MTAGLAYDGRQPPMTPGPDIAALSASARWQLRLLGAFELVGAHPSGLRLPSRASMALLARLALGPGREHAREELIELLWPGVELDVGRNRLRQTLSTLKALLEPPGTAAVIVADRRSLRLAPGALACDVTAFERELRGGRLAAAAALYRGELMPGFFDEWISDERRRLQALADRLPASATATATASASAPAPAPAPARSSATPAAVVAATDAPVQPVAWSRHALPTYLTRYFGHDAQAARLRGQVLAHRLVTLVGPGGIGKTRLAVELALALRDTPALGAEDGAQPPFERFAFVGLAACTELSAMQDTLAQAFALNCPGAELGERLVAVLAGQRTLLVLDNLEQLLPAAAPWLARLAAALPQLHLLVTSRRVLALDGEREVALGPLPLPAPAADARADAAERAANPAVAMFVDRARAVRADFHLGARNTEAVAALVRVLGGAPLAIELAAARVRTLSVAEMLQRLDPALGALPGQGLALLARAGPRSGQDLRHASMAEVIAWSWALLPAALQRTLVAMTVFVGGFDAAAAAAVVQGDAALQLDEAVQHSLLGVERLADARLADARSADSRWADDRLAEDRLRFVFAEPVREFALARLPEHFDAAAAAALRRASRDWWPRWMATLGATVPLAAFRAELPNLVAALASAEADGDAAAGVALALALAPGFAVVPLPGGGLDLLQRLLDALPAPHAAPLRSAGLSLLAAQEFEAGLRERAEAHAAQALDSAAAGTPERARALQVAARLRWTAHHDREGARALLDEAEPLAERLGDAALLATLLAQRAYVVHLSVGEHAAAERLFERQRQLLRGLGNRHAWHGALYHRINLDYQQNRYRRTIEGARELVALARAESDWSLLSKTANVLGGAHNSVREWRQALPCFLEAAEVAWADSLPFAWSYAIWNLPTSLVRCGQPADALCLMAFAAAHWTRRYGELSAGDRRSVQRLARLARVGLKEAKADASRRAGELEREGAALSPAQAMQRLRSAVAAALARPASA